MLGKRSFFPLAGTSGSVPLSGVFVRIEFLRTADDVLAEDCQTVYMLPVFLLYAALCFASIELPDATFPSFPKQIDKESIRKKIAEMFNFGYSNYLHHAYPMDELDPIHCIGRGHDFTNRKNLNVNDALGNYQLTMVDSLDSLAVFGNTTAFKHAVRLLTDTLHFGSDTVVQVFEATIRVIGGLLSAHLLIIDPLKRFGNLRPENYANELLLLAHDLANRLSVAFEVHIVIMFFSVATFVDTYKGTPTGIPFPRVHLASSTVETFGRRHNCLAGAGSLLLEFGTLSALLNDPTYASAARRVVLRLWQYRSNVTGLLGTDIDIFDGRWTNQMTGVGAGQDSFYEYLLKARIVFNDETLGEIFDEALRSLRFHLRGPPTKNCSYPDGLRMAYKNVNMFTGSIANYWLDSLQMVWPAILVLAGEVDDARCQHLIHYNIWQRFRLPPERYNLLSKLPDMAFYPLRPEFAESTYHLYRATKDIFYLRVGAEIVDALEKFARSKCGYATIHNVEKMTQEDRMESFFLSETLKYLYLLFDETNPLNRYEEDYLLTTQGHILPISTLRRLTETMVFNPFPQLRKSLRPEPFRLLKKSTCKQVWEHVHTSPSTKSMKSALFETIKSTVGLPIRCDLKAVYMGISFFRGACGDVAVMSDEQNQNIMFTIGETEPRRRIPSSLAERLNAPRPQALSPEEKQRQSEERVKELKDERQRKLREHNDKVKRISEERQKQRAAAKEQHDHEDSKPSHDAQSSPV